MRFNEFKEGTQSAFDLTALFEAAEGKNLHLQHLEDEIFNLGFSGAKKSLDYVEHLVSMLADGAGDKVKISVKWDGCIHPDTLILTENGPVKIIDIINAKVSVNVMTHDFENNIDKLCPAEIPRINNNNKDWVEIELENGEILKLTEDHEVYVVNKGWICAKDLHEDDDVLEFKLNK